MKHSSTYRSSWSTTVFAFAAVVLAVILMFFYLPAQKKITDLKAELSNLEGQIRRIEQKVGAGKSMQEGIRRLREEFYRLDSRFPAKEEKSLEQLSELAKELGLEVISMKSQPRAPLLDSDGREVTVDGKACQKLPVSIELKGTYQLTQEYLKRIRDQVPAKTMVEKLRIQDLPGKNGQLRVLLDMNLFLLSA